MLFRSVETENIKVFFSTVPTAAQAIQDAERTNRSVESILEDYETAISKAKKSVAQEWIVHPSTNRVNMDLEVDLVEEVARMLGYDAIPETLPNIRVNDSVRGVDAPMKATRALKEVLVGLGFQEIVSYSFTNPLEAERARVPMPVLELQNAQSSERTHLRTQLEIGRAHV